MTLVFRNQPITNPTGNSMLLRKFVTNANKAGGFASTLGLVMALSLQFVPGAAQSQTSFPNRPVNLIVPVPPGGILDTVARMVVPPMTQTLGSLWSLTTRQAPVAT